MMGVRFSLYPLCNDFVPLILAAVAGLERYRRRGRDRRCLDLSAGRGASSF